MYRGQGVKLGTHNMQITGAKYSDVKVLVIESGVFFGGLMLHYNILYKLPVGI